MSNIGYIALHRKIEDSFVYQDSGLLHLWIHCLIKASHTDRTIMFDGQSVNIKRGQFITGRKSLSKTLNTTEQKIRNRLGKLLENNKVTQKTTNRYSIITVVKYDYYQTDRNKVTSRQPADNQQTTTNNNGNNENNISDANASGSIIPLTDKEKDMGWNNKPSDNDEDMPAIDLDSQEEIETNGSKAERETKELNTKIRANLKVIEPLRGMVWGTGKDMNFHVKIYRELLKKGVSHEGIIKTFIEIVDTPHWKEKKKQGEYPGMNTVQFHLRNKTTS